MNIEIKCLTTSVRIQRSGRQIHEIFMKDLAMLAHVLKICQIVDFYSCPLAIGKYLQIKGP